MADERQSEELSAEQRRRETTEWELADSTADDTEAAQHQRRAEKARYLRGKLEEREASERGRTGKREQDR